MEINHTEVHPDCPQRALKNRAGLLNTERYAWVAPGDLQLDFSSETSAVL